MAELAARNKSIADRYVVSGEKMPAIAAEFGISRERVRQLVEKYYPGYHRGPKPRLSKAEKREIRHHRRARLFWDRVRVGAIDECWEYQGYRHPTNYGAFRIDGEEYTHRVAWTLTYGKIPDGLQVLHRCDNPPCCNPAHLWLGTRQDNMIDRDNKKRGAHFNPDFIKKATARLIKARKEHPEKFARGGQVRTAKLTEDQVIEIRKKHADGMRVCELARNYGLSSSTMYKLVEGRTWKHLL